MTKISEIIDLLEKMAPLSTQEDWDNSGWQVKLNNNEAKKVMLALSVTADTAKQAISKGCELLITHHPLIFGDLKQIDENKFVGEIITLATKNNLSIYSSHTSLDVAKGGTRDTLAKVLELKNIEIQQKYLAIGELENETPIDEFISLIKKVLNTKNISLINQPNITKIKKIAICAGSGGDFIGNLDDVDLFLSSDIKYHQTIEATKFAVIDAGHLETERIVLPELKGLLSNAGVEVFIADEKNLVNIC